MSYNQLIILGNGFDLACGLKSSFKDFHSTRKERIEGYKCDTLTNVTAYVNHVHNIGLTLWDFIIDNEGPKFWWDVEKIIEMNIIAFNKLTYNDFGRIGNQQVLSYEEYSPEWFSERMISKLDGTINLSDITKSSNFMGYICSLYRPFKNENFLEFINRSLVCELQNYEREFQLYLLNEIESNTRYKERSSLLYNDLHHSSLTKITIGNSTLLNFNYTKPNINSKPEIYEVNIHGSLDKGIIFGIDGQKYLSANLVRVFTKTYRVMANSNSEINIYNKKINDYQIIKFFGHSLAEADYSYFQTIFDRCSLYDSETHLLFYYRLHPGCNKPEEDTINKVAKLLSTYGKTLNNKDHGKNLMHKLILEGRLSIVPFNVMLEKWHKEDMGLPE